MKENVMRQLLFLSLCIVLISPAMASDGVLEINQACAVNTGCFSSDTPGFPVQIANPGSYTLTGNLTVDRNTSAIEIDVDAVAIDLGGFSISGPCVGGPNCAPTGSGGAVVAWGHTDISIKNGFIRGMGNIAMGLDNDAVIDGVHMTSNGNFGLACTGRCRVSNSSATKNKLSGFHFQNEGSIIRESTASGNGLHGIHATLSTIIIDNIVTENLDDGIVVEKSSRVQGNTVRENGGDGITANTDLDANLIIDNTVFANGGYGLNLNAHGAYRGNSMRSNTSGAVQNGVEIGTNFCINNTTCP